MTYVKDEVMKPRLLDLFCGAGGAAVGYHRAGFEVIGVDIEPQPDYPFEFHQADAMTFPLDEYDVIHASPPCQAHTTMSNRWRGQYTLADEHEDFIAPIRERLVASGKHYIIENVGGARYYMHDPVMLTGGQFGLGVHRPRFFEATVFFQTPPSTKPLPGVIGVYGAMDGRRLRTRVDGSILRAAATLEEAQKAMGMEWVTKWHGIKEAIPPAFTEYLGRQLILLHDDVTGFPSHR